MSRRAKGEGAVFKRKRDGRFVARHEGPPGPDGRRRRKDFVRDTRPEAVRARKEWLDSPEAKRWEREGAFEAMTVEAVVPIYVASFKRPGTRRTQGALLGKHVLGVHYRREGRRAIVDRVEPTALAGLRLTDVTRHHVRELVETIEAPTARDGVHKALASLFAFAVDRGWLDRSPLADVKGPGRVESDGKRIRVWTPEQARVFDESPAVRRHCFGPMFRWWLGTGLRPGEVYALQWTAIDLAAGTVRIEASYDAREKETAETKTDASVRTIDLDPASLAILKALPHREGFVWRARGGRPVNEGSARNSLGRLCVRIGLPRLTTHELRHTHATLLLLDRVPPHEVARRLGHASAVQTLRTYAHFLPSHAQAAASIAKTLGRGAEPAGPPA